jgi:hypothetical protein
MVLGDNKSSRGDSGANFSVLVRREDGLGERLRAVVHGSYLANYLQLEFKFCWPSKSFASEFHAIESEEKIFASHFLKKHFLSDLPKGFKDYLKVSQNNKIALPLKLDGLLTSGFKGLYFDDLDVRRVLEDDLDPDLNLNLVRAFQNIEFSEQLSQVMDTVQTIKLSNKTVAVHVRGGDIVYGPYRFFQHFQDKVLPLPIAKYLLNTLVSQGYEPIVFVQDEAVKKSFNNLPNLRLSSDFVKETYSNLEQAFFDILLMSRCTQIFAGSSGFAELAAVISGQTVKQYAQALSSKEKISIIQSDLRKSPAYDNFQLAFAWFSYTLYGETFLTGDKIDKALKKAQRLDPENQLYRVKRVVNFLAHKLPKKAERLLERIIEDLSDSDNPFNSEFFKILAKKHGKKFGMRNYFKLFISAKKISKPYTLLCKAYIYYVTQNYDACNRVLRKFEAINEYNLGFRKCYQLLSKGSKIKNVEVK